MYLKKSFSHSGLLVLGESFNVDMLCVVENPQKILEKKGNKSPGFQFT